MRLALDARTLSAPKTGDRTVVLGLLQGLLALEGPEAPREIWAIANQAMPEGLLPDSPRLRRLVVPRPGGCLWTPLALPRALRQARADVGVIQYLAPFHSPCPLVTFIHDTVWRTMPATFPRRDRLILDALIPGTVARAAAICTGSRFAAEEIVHHFPHAAGKVHVIPYGVEDRYRVPRDAALRQAVHRKYDLPPRFILSVGVLQPRKNVTGLIRAYHLLPADLRAEYGLVIVGKQGWLTKALPDLAREAGPGVRFTGYVPDEDLPALYSLGTAFAYPSLYEGYGLPPLEAMACGTPVLTSNVASLPEVTAGAALLVDPTDPEAIAEGLRQLLTDEPMRQALIAKGLARAKELTWEAAARQLVAVCGAAVA